MYYLDAGEIEGELLIKEREGNVIHSVRLRLKDVDLLIGQLQAWKHSAEARRKELERQKRRLSELLDQFTETVDTFVSLTTDIGICADLAGRAERKDVDALTSKAATSVCSVRDKLLELVAGGGN